MNHTIHSSRTLLMEKAANKIQKAFKQRNLQRESFNNEPPKVPESVIEQELRTQRYLMDPTSKIHVDGQVDLDSLLDWEFEKLCKYRQDIETKIVERKKDIEASNALLFDKSFQRNALIRKSAIVSNKMVEHELQTNRCRIELDCFHRMQRMNHAIQQWRHLQTLEDVKKRVKELEREGDLIKLEPEKKHEIYYSNHLNAWSENCVPWWKLRKDFQDLLH